MTADSAICMQGDCACLAHAKKPLPAHVTNGCQLCLLLKLPTCALLRCPALVQTIPLGNEVYLLGGLTNAAELDEKAGPAAGPTVPLVLNATVAYDTYTMKSTELAPMPQPR